MPATQTLRFIVVTNKLRKQHQLARQEIVLDASDVSLDIAKALDPELRYETW